MRSGGAPTQAGAISVAQPRSGPIDPSQTNVFVKGPDGQLHPIPGWKTTGPFDFATWAKNIDWGGVGRDLATIAAGAVAGGGTPRLMSRLGAAGVTAEGLTGADRLTLGGGLYSTGDQALREMDPPKRPKHW
jgi:hypothetical protein